jgi:hypothetical protein
MKLVCVSAVSQTPVMINLIGSIKVKQDGNNQQLRGAGPDYHVFDANGLYIRTEPYAVTAQQRVAAVPAVKPDTDEELTILAPKPETQEQNEEKEGDSK